MKGQINFSVFGVGHFTLRKSFPISWGEFQRGITGSIISSARTEKSRQVFFARFFKEQFPDTPGSWGAIRTIYGNAAPFDILSAEAVIKYHKKNGVSQNEAYHFATLLFNWKPTLLTARAAAGGVARAKRIKAEKNKRKKCIDMP